MNEKNNKTATLTQTGIIILVITLIASVIMTVFGGITLLNDSKISTYTVIQNVEKSISGGAYKYYDIKFTPPRNYSGNYTISLSGAYVTSIKNSDGDKIDSSMKNDSPVNTRYEQSYSVYLSGANTYTIRIFSTSSDIRIHVSL